ETAIRARASDALAGRRPAGSAHRLVVLGWVGVAATALLCAALYIALRTPSFRPTPSAVVLPEETALLLQESLARQSAARYLRDSRSILVNLLQAPVRCRRVAGHFDVALERERSLDLLRRKSLYEGALRDLQDRRLASLLAQI